MVAIVDLIANVRLQIVQLMYCPLGNLPDVFADLDTRFRCEHERRYSTSGGSSQEKSSNFRF